MTTIRQPPTRSKWGTAVGVAADAGGGEMKGASQLGHRSPGFVTVVKQAGQRTYRAIEPAAGTVSCTGSVLPQARQRPASVVFAPQNGHGCVRSVTADVASMFSSGPWMKPAALSYVRSARLVNSNLHGARYRAAGARPGRSPAGCARLSPPARSRAGGAHLPTLSGLRSMESQNRGSSAPSSEPPRPTAPIRIHGDVARRYSARGSTRMGAVWFFGSVVPRRSESPRNKSCAVACVRSVASHQLLN